MRAQHDDRQQRSTHQQHARPPAIGERAEAELRHRARQLVAHRQDADRLQRQAKLRNQQRQQRREHVAVGIDDEVRGRRRPDRRDADRSVSTDQPSKATQDHVARFVELADAEEVAASASTPSATAIASPHAQRLETQRADPAARACSHARRTTPPPPSAVEASVTLTKRHDDAPSLDAAERAPQQMN